MKAIEKISKRWQRISFSSDRHEHYPVMYKEVLDFLQPDKRKVVADCTLGMGGHAKLLIESMPEDGILFGFDRDSESLEIARKNLEQFKDRIKLFHCNHSDIENVLSQSGIEKIDAFVFDLGLSMYQLDSAERGFSFLKDGALDMRMDRTASISAYDLVNHLSEKELEEIIREYGEERFSRKIAREIVYHRKKGAISTTTQLASIIAGVIVQKGGRHPATQTFQALRIAVNREFDSATQGIKTAMQYLAPGGRIAVITFHSSEDRMIKHLFREAKQSGEFVLVNKKPLIPERNEIRENSRSRSAKLRVIEKL